MLKNKKIKNRLEILEEKVLVNPNNCKSQLDLGRAYLDLGQYKKALPSLIWAQKLSPESFETNYYLALGYFLKNKFEEGIDFAKLACELKPKNPKASKLYQRFKLEIKYQKNKEAAIISGLFGSNKKIELGPKVDELQKNLNTKITTYSCCDGFCKPCKLKNSCRAYQKRLSFEKSCRQKGQDPHDIDAIIEEIENMLTDVKGNVEEQIKSLGVEIKIIDQKNLRNEKELHKQIINSKLFRQIKKFSSASKNFLDQVFEVIDEDPMIGAVLHDELEKIIHYSQICEPKTYRALSSLVINLDDKDFQDAFSSLSLVYESLNVCQNSLSLIAEVGESSWAIEAIFLTTQIQDLQNYLLKNYPQIKIYRQKIIINSDYENKFTQ